jgi:hypothetical protein
MSASGITQEDLIKEYVGIGQADAETAEAALPGLLNQLADLCKDSEAKNVILKQATEAEHTLVATERALNALCDKASEETKQLIESFQGEIISNLDACDVQSVAASVRAKQDYYNLLLTTKLYLIDQILPEARVAKQEAKVASLRTNLPVCNLTAECSRLTMVAAMAPLLKNESRMAEPIGERTLSLLAAARAAETSLQSATESLRTMRIKHEQLTASRAALGHVKRPQY